LVSTSVTFDFATVVVLPLSATEAALPPGLALVLIDVETLPEVEDWIAPFVRGAGWAETVISAIWRGWAFPIFAGAVALTPADPACPIWVRPFATFAVPAGVFPPLAPRADEDRVAETETGLALEPAFAEVFTFTMGTLTPPKMGKRTCNPNRLF
jgi:hypothetical protein